MQQIDYGSLISRAAAATWRFKFLWIFAILAGTGGLDASFNFSFNGGTGGGRPSGTSGSIGSPGSFDGAPFLQMAEWLTRNAWIIILVIAFLAAIVLVLTLLSIVCQGAMARATLDIADDKDVTLGEAWAGGLRLFWRIFRLRLLFFLVGVVFLIAGVLAVAMVVVAGDLRAVVIVPLMLLGIAAALVFIPIWIVAGIVVPLAIRIIADDDEISVVGALIFGWRLFRATLLPGFVTWAIAFGLGIAIGIVTMIPILIMLVVLFLIGLLLAVMTNGSPALIAYAVLCVVLLMVVGGVLGAVRNSFFWHYWSLAYRRLQAVRDVRSSEAIAGSVIPEEA